MYFRLFIASFVTAFILSSCSDELEPAITNPDITAYEDIDLNKGVSIYLDDNQVHEIGKEDLEEVDRLLINGLTSSKSYEKNAVIELASGSIDGLQSAVDQAEEGDEILIKSGTHTETGTVTITKKITIRGEDEAEIIFDVQPVESLGAIEPALYINGVNHVEIYGIRLSASSSLGGTGILIEESDRTIIMNNTLNNFQFGILVEDGNRSRILRNTLNNSSDWQLGTTQNVNGITIINGNQSLIIGNTTNNAIFGAFLSDFRGFYFSNSMSGNFHGAIFCNVPPNSFPLPSGKLVGSNRPARKWFALFNRSTENLNTGFLIIDGARKNYFASNSVSNNGLYDFELAGTSERFGFTTPPSVDNWVRATHGMIIKDCGEDNRVDGIALVDLNEDPCEVLTTTSDFEIGINEQVLLTTSVDNQSFPFDIIIPEGYDAMSDQKYPLLIFLHGADGNNKEALSPSLLAAQNQLNSDGSTEPMIIIVPTIIPDQPEQTFGNRHVFFNSEYYGNYEDVILKDLIGWLKKSDFANLKDKISFARESMAIGGFSMGGDGALRIGLRNPDIFSTIAAHGAAPSLARPLIAGGIVPAVLAESPLSDSIYSYDPSNGLFSNIVFGISAAWIGLEDSEVEFLLSTNGTLDEDAYSKMVNNADCATIINSHDWTSEELNAQLPKLLIEIGSDDAFKGFNDYFIGVDVTGLNIASDKFQYTISEGKGHGFDTERAAEMLKSLF